MKSPRPPSPVSPLARAFSAALRNEADGLVFYRLAAAGAKGDAARRLYSFLADEEDRHYRTVLAQAEALAKGKGIRIVRPAASKRELGGFLSPLFTGEFLAEAGKAEGETAVLSVAMTLERKSIRQFLSMRKKAEGDGEAEGALDALVSWERDHLELLSRQYAALREEAWEGAGFWPF
jgi:rubrerythrin